MSQVAFVNTKSATPQVEWSKQAWNAFGALIIKWPETVQSGRIKGSILTTPRSTAVRDYRRESSHASDNHLWIAVEAVEKPGALSYSYVQLEAR
jgi:hypothetical protein